MYHWLILVYINLPFTYSNVYMPPYKVNAIPDP